MAQEPTSEDPNELRATLSQQKEEYEDIFADMHDKMRALQVGALAKRQHSLLLLNLKTLSLLEGPTPHTITIPCEDSSGISCLPGNIAITSCQCLCCFDDACLVK